MKIIILGFLILAIQAKADIPAGCPDIQGIWNCRFDNKSSHQMEISVDAALIMNSSNQTEETVYRYQIHYLRNGVSIDTRSIGYISVSNNANGKDTVAAEDRSGGTWVMSSKCSENKLVVKSEDRLDATHMDHSEFALLSNGNLEISSTSTIAYSFREKETVTSKKICTRN